MTEKVQRRSPAVRARHGKRLPQFFDDDDSESSPSNIPGPVTLTVVRPPPTSTQVVASIPATPIPTPTVTVFVTPSGFTSSPSVSSLSTFSTLSTAPVPTPTSSQGTTTSIQKPLPSASAENKNKMDVAQSNASSSPGMPIGSIIGIVLAVILILIAGIVFLVRKRSVRNRLKLRGWANKNANTPSFLWIEPGDKNGITPYPNMSYPAPNRGGVSTGAPFSNAQAQPTYGNGLPYIPPPAPPRPPPAHGTAMSYDYGPGVPVGFPAALTPGGGTPRELRSPALSPAMPPPPSLPTQSAKVKSTFIPTLPDELSISTGEVIRIQAEYDDGWALCFNARGETGMVPLECLDRGSASQIEEAREYKKLTRASSLAASPYSLGSPYGGTY